MNSSGLRRGALVLALLAVGVALSYLWLGSAEPQSSFRPLLWEGRHSDLAVQLGLMLVGAFGIRALLPSSLDDEHQDDEHQDDGHVV